MKNGLEKLYLPVRGEIVSRLEEFRRIWETGSEESIFAELIFCILTPQSRAKLCWAAVQNLERENLLLEGSEKRIVRELEGVRFKYKKAEYIIGARKQFSGGRKSSIRSEVAKFDNACDAREWLVQNVRGLGYKEASHFLRNIGLGEDFAILDRHILKNLKLFGIIEEIPDALPRKRYLDIEKRMKEFAKKIKIPVSHLDLLLWHKETGEVFK